MCVKIWKMKLTLKKKNIVEHYQHSARATNGSDGDSVSPDLGSN